MRTNGVTFVENPADEPDVFPVEVISNPKWNMVISGGYELHVNMANVALVDTTTDKPVFTWPFRYIRRYGAGNGGTFQLEAGRRCPSGEGMFVFDVSPRRGDVVFACLQKRLNVMMERDLHDQSDATAIRSASSGKPVVPDRLGRRCGTWPVAAAARGGAPEVTTYRGYIYVHNVQDIIKKL